MLNLKKIYTLTILFLLAANSKVFAQGEVKIDNPLGDKGLEDIIQGLVNFIFGLALLICPIFVIWGGFEMATAAGSEEKFKNGKKKIIYSLVGLLIIALSTTFVEVVKNILGVT